MDAVEITPRDHPCLSAHRRLAPALACSATALARPAASLLERRHRRRHLARLPHPNGVVIHNDVEIGPNCLIFQQVTLGARRGRVPRLGGHVDIGAGAKLLGGIVVGDDALIGANAVVLDDVPAGATVVGIPAVVVASSGIRSP